MPSRRVNSSERGRTKSFPATTPEGREQQLIALAVDVAERQLRDGSASAQVITHYLKLGSPREQLERERLENENALLEAKRLAYESAQRSEELYAQAIQAFKSYSGQSTDEVDE